jgi:hypothetical protein
VCLGAGPVQLLGVGEPSRRAGPADVPDGTAVELGRPRGHRVVDVQELLDGDGQRIAERVARLLLLGEQPLDERRDVGRKSPPDRDWHPPHDRIVEP